MRRHRHDRAQVAGVLAFALLTTFPTYWHGFVWDDPHLLHQSDTIRRGGSAWRVFSPAYWRAEHLAKGATYRPVPEVSFIASYAIGDGSPGPFHLTNVALHALVCVGVLALARSLFGGCASAYGIAVLFAVHPVHAETVAWIKNGAELWAVAFALGAFVCYVRAAAAWSERRAASCAYVAAGLCCFALGAASMEVGLLIVGAMFLYAVAGKGRGAPALAMFGLFAAAAVGARAFQVWVQVGAAQATGSGSPGAARFWGGAIVFAEYWRYLLVPVHLSADHYLDFARLSARASSLVGVAALAGVSVWLWRWRAARPALVWALAAVAAFCNIAAAPDRPFAEQRAYFPSIGACALMCFAFVRLPRRPARGLLGMAIIALSALTVSQCLAWRSEGSLWRRTVVRSPEHHRPWFNLSTVYAAADRLAESERLIHLSLRRQPRYARARDALGRLDQMRGDHESALAHFRAAARDGPRFAYAWNNMGISLSALSRTHEAVDALTRAIRGRRSYKQAHLNRAKLYVQTRDYAKAEADLTAGLGLTLEQDARIHCELGDLCRRRGRWNQAIQHYGRATRLDPTYAPAFAQLANVQCQQHDAATAVGNYSTALALDPDLAEARHSFGAALASLGLRVEAIAQLKQAIRLSPELGSQHGGLLHQLLAQQPRPPRGSR